MPGQFIADDLAHVLSQEDDGAIAITFNGRAITGIFDAAFALLDEMTGHVTATVPKITVVESDVADGVEGTAVTVSGVAYKVYDIQPDGTGMAEVFLHKA